MTMCESILRNKSMSIKKEVIAANNSKLPIECIGDVKLNLLCGVNKIDATLHNVQYVPNLCANLLSVAQMVRNGNRVSFDANGCHIFNKNGDLIGVAPLIDNMYKLQLARDSIVFAAAAVDKVRDDNNNNTSFIWHRRLGHVNFDTLKQISKTANGLDFVDVKAAQCETCIMGKQSRIPFPKEGKRSEEPLQLVHSDVCGPMSENSLGGGRYFVTFLDDFSRKLFVYILREKSEVYSKFIEFKNLTERQTGRKIKMLRTDNGTEYVNKSFLNFCKSNGVIHQKSTTYTPQQNGMAERMNRTIMEKVRCMLIDAKLPLCFWAEAVTTAAFIVNRIPCKGTGLKSPEEVWTGAKPDLSGMRIFGCRAMVHIPNERRKKLDPKSSACILLGFSSESKAYRLYDQSKRKIVVSRDVIFIECPQTVQVIENSNENFNSVLSPSDNLIDESINSEPNGECSNDSQIENSDDAAEMSTTEPKVTTNSNTESNERCAEPNEMHEASDANASHIIIINDSDNFNPDVSRIDNEDEDSTDQTYTSDFMDDESLSEIGSSDIPQRPRRNVPIQNYAESSFAEFAFLTLDDPVTVSEAMSSDAANQWKSAMADELQSLQQNDTWRLTDLPAGKTPIKCKWVFKTKRDANGHVMRHKARLVVKGYSQREGIDYHETFSPVVRYSSIRFLLAMAAKYDLNIRQMDVVTAFLHGELKETIYMEQPQCFNDGSGRVCKLQRSLYGLKQSSRVWNEKLNSVLLAFGLKRSGADQCIYHLVQGNKMLYVAVYVDDVLIFSNDNEIEKRLKGVLCNNFRMKDLGDASSVLGVRIVRDRAAGTIAIDQSQYISNVLKRFGMEDANPVATPLDINQKISSKMCPSTRAQQIEMAKVPYKQAIGCLLFAAQITRPDINFAVNLLSRYSTNPGQAHWAAIKRLLRYLKGSIDKKLVYRKDSNEIEGFCDADWASDLDQRKSTTGYVFVMQGAAVSWASRRQQTIALSTTEAEFMALVAAMQETVWLKRLEHELFGATTTMTLHCDNKGAIQLALNGSYSSRTKHVDIKANFIREKLEERIVELKYIGTDEMLADILTKGMIGNKQVFFCKQIGLI